MLFIIALILFTVFPNEQKTSTEIISADLNCSIGDNNYLITIREDNYFKCMECNKDMRIYLKDITDYANIEHSVENIEKYFEDNGGSCK